jgi:hypothetical protein
MAVYSLPILYLHPGIAFTLAGTGQLLQHVRRRLEDTKAFTNAVMTPGALQPGGAGQLWIRKVRLMHALVRRMMSPQQDADAQEKAKVDAVSEARRVYRDMRAQAKGGFTDKVPVDQIEMAFTLQSFAWAIVDGLRKMGWGMTQAEALHHVHAWSAIGYLMGIEKPLLPAGPDAVREAEGLFCLIRDDLLERGDPFQPKPGDQDDAFMSGRLLVAAWITMLVEFQREWYPPPLQHFLGMFPWVDEALQQLPRILIRHLCGTQAARSLRIGHAGLIDQFICALVPFFYDLRKLADGFDSTPRQANAAPRAQDRGA